MSRSGKQSDLQIQPRDLALLRGLFESRVMTTAHIAALYFAGSREAAKKRLQKLKAARLVGERKRRVNEPSVLFLTRKGHSILTAENQLSEFPKLSSSAFEKRANVSDLTLRHELEVMDVKAAFDSALRKSEAVSIAEFSTWPVLHQFIAIRAGYDREEVLVKPDGFIRFHEKEKDGSISEHTFFLEVDRSSETQDTLLNRASCYLDHYKSGGFAVQNDAPRSAYKEFPFRVLIVLKNAERRNNTAERLLQSNPPILTLAYLSTFAEVTANPIGPIWVRPSDYRDALIQTDFNKGTQATVYRRQAKREALVEQSVKKVSLFESN